MSGSEFTALQPSRTSQRETYRSFRSEEQALNLAERAGPRRCLDRMRAEITVTGPWSAVQTETVMAGSETEFAALVSQNQRRVFQIAYSVLGNAADAEDVAQETFLSAYRHLGSLQDGEKFRAWVNRIAFRCALNRRRAVRRSVLRDTAWHTTVPETTDGERVAQDHLLLAQLRQTMEKLPRKLRLVLQLSVVDEMDAAGIGAVLGIPAGTVRSRLHAARKLLLEAMK